MCEIFNKNTEIIDDDKNVYIVRGVNTNSEISNIYKVERKCDNKLLILKTLKDEYETDNKSTYPELFFKNELSFKNLKNKRIVEIYGRVVINKREYICMEYIEGQTLQQWLNNNKMEYIEGQSLQQCLSNNETKQLYSEKINQRLEILEGVCKGLNFFHKNRFYHRDIKPGNIILRERDNKKTDIVCIDFGLSGIYGNKIKGIITEHGRIGTRYYMSPEQTMGEKRFRELYGDNERFNYRTDIYAVSALAYIIFTNERVPFVYNDYEDNQIRKELPKKNIGEETYKVIEKGLSFLPSKRYDDIMYFFLRLKDSFLSTKEKEKMVNRKNIRIPDFTNLSIINNEKDVKNKSYFEINDYDPRPSRYYFMLVEDNNTFIPIKLGDGTFGVVYLAFNERGDKFAVKLFYKGIDDTIPPFRLTDEMITFFKYNFDLVCKEDNDSNFEYKKYETYLECFNELKKPHYNIVDFKSALKVSLELFLEELKNNQVVLKNANELINNFKKNDEEKIDVFQILFDFVMSMVKESDAFIRFYFESNVNKIVNRIVDDSQITGLVKIEGGTTKFTTYPIYKNHLEKHLEGSGIKISNYALVMDKFDITLKEILENGIDVFTIRKLLLEDNFRPSNSIPAPLLKIAEKKVDPRKKIQDEIDTLKEISDEQKRMARKSIAECNGYDIIKNLNFKERIQTILPFVTPVVQGIRTLHMAKLFHLDIKPGNIYIKEESQRIKCVLGDLGFLFQDNLKTTSVATFHNIRPLGTVHYRSPEQKNYFDICDVEITIEEKNTVLKTRDPKFKKTIIEKGDLLTFSKDFIHNQYTIKSIDPDGDSYIIEVEEDLQGFSHNEKTQIIIYKQQKFRTDLFGIGAVFFDMFTGGFSPEEFYEDIKFLDNKNENITEIMNKYDQVRHNQTNDSSLIHAFKPFQHFRTNQYAPPRIVKLIMQCILYKVDQTFYSKSMQDKCLAADLLLKELLELEQEYSEGAPDQTTSNNLYKGELSGETNGDEDSTTSNPSFLFRIRELQEKVEKTDMPSRLVFGIWYLRKLANLIDLALNNAENTNFLSQMLPDNINLRKEPSENKLEFKSVVYKKSSEYHKDLLEDRVYTRFLTDGLNPYIPDYINYMRRSLTIEKIDSYRFTKFSLKEFLHKLSSKQKKEILELCLSINEQTEDQLTIFISSNELTSLFKDADKYQQLLFQSADNIFRFNFPMNHTICKKIEPGDWFLINDQLWRVDEVFDETTMKLYQYYRPSKNEDMKSHESLNLEIEKTVENTESNEQTKIYNDETTEDKHSSVQDFQQNENNSLYNEQNFIQMGIFEPIFYHNIEPCRYYMETLGVYLYNIFFVGINNDFDKIPKVKNVLDELINLYNDWDVIQFPNNKKLPRIFTSVNKEFEDIVIFLASMYFKLAFTNHRNSYYIANEKDNKRIISALRDDIDNIEKKIEKFLNLPGKTIDSTLESLENIFENKANVDLSKYDNLKIKNFYELSKNIVSIKIPYNDIVTGLISGALNKKYFNIILNLMSKKEKSHD